MSNKCEPPSKNVDALGAGDAGISAMWGTFKSYFTMVAPFLIWYYVIPELTSLIFSKEMMQVE